MKANIHPNWQHDTVVTCTCGNTFITGSTQATIQVDICSQCHPFFTGEMKFVDRQGRVDKFLAKQQAAAAKQAALQAKTKKKSGQTSDDDNEPKSYKDLLREQQQALKQKSQKGSLREKAASPTN